MCLLDVVLTQDNVTNFPVAIKLLRTDVASPDKVAFMKEAVIMGQFAHRNVVKMYGVVVDSDPVGFMLHINQMLESHKKFYRLDCEESILD